MFWAVVGSIKFVAILAGMIFFWLYSEWIHLFFSEKKSAMILRRHARWVIAWMLKILNVKVHSNLVPIPSGSLLVANHLSYLDILVIHLYYPSVFITSTDIMKMPLLGRLCQNTGSLVVHRRWIWNLHREIDAICRELENGERVILFPEATTSDHSRVLPFRSSLMEAAVQTHAQLIPLALNYVSINRRPICSANRDRVCWYGDMTFLDHLWKLCCLASICMELKVLPPISKQGGLGRKSLTRLAYERIQSQVLQIKPGNQNLLGFYGDKVMAPPFLKGEGMQNA